jgi:valyl-tRNA synthetase
MWTFSTLGWPASAHVSSGEARPTKTGDLARFHPTQVLETGYELITLWVSRMIMMSLFAVGEVPFETVYLHGMILDKQGKKMSKSKGNGIDPLEVSAKFGTDAVRLSLLIGTTPGNDSRISEERIEAERNFVNKLWNIARYIIESTKSNPPTGGTNSKTDTKIDTDNLTLADVWILTKLDQVIITVTEAIKRYDYSQAGDCLKEFTWNDVADWYLEATKFQTGTETNKVLTLLLENILKLWHPFIPFVTEHIWRTINPGKNLIITAWPQPLNLTTATAEQFEQVKNIITAIRTGRSENGVEPAKKLDAVIYAGAMTQWLNENLLLLQKLKTGLGDLSIVESGQKPDDAISLLVGDCEIYLLGAVDKTKERQRLTKELANLSAQIASLELRLGNEDFVAKAPEVLITKQREQLSEAKNSLAKVTEALELMA